MITHGTVTSHNGEVVMIESDHEDAHVVEFRDRIEIGISAIGSYRDLITVYKAHERYGTGFVTEVNWGAVGSQSPEKTLMFAKALQYAAELALQVGGKNEWDGIIKFREQ